MTYRGSTVVDDKCDLCRGMEEGNAVEDRTHYLRCVAHREIRRKITTAVKNIINNAADEYVRQVPCYWNEDEKGRAAREDWKSIEEFTPEDAAAALIPISWVQYLQKIRWKKETDVERIIAACQRVVVEGFLECWQARCAKFYRLHPVQARGRG